MNENTDKVTLDLEEYNDLRDFRKGINESYFILSHPSWFSGGRETIYYRKKDEVVSSLTNEIKVLESRIYDLNNPPKKIEISDFYGMNLWQIIKWKLKN